jgi:hypothetical protein
VTRGRNTRTAQKLKEITKSYDRAVSNSGTSQKTNKSPARGASRREQVQTNRPQKKDIWKGMSTEQRLTAEYENARRKRTRKY